MKKTISLDKHARVVNLRRSTYTTTRAAAALLKAARDDGIPEHISESTQHRYRRALCSRETPYGTLVQDLALPHAVIAVQNPLAMLHVSVQESESLARCISDSINAYGLPSPEEPWRLIWYHDEIGISPLAAHDANKNHGVLLELRGVWQTFTMQRKPLVCHGDCSIRHHVESSW